MQLNRCDNGHYYDSSKHSSCPHCGVQNLDIDIQRTMPKQNLNIDLEKTQPRKGGTKEEGSSFGDGEGKTVGIYRKKLGIDPVVGWLVAIKGADRGRDFRIRSERNFIGRSDRMDISISGDESVSRENHAIVSYNPKKSSFRIMPGDSRGLVYLNDEEVITPEELKAYDIIEVGQTKLMFVPFCGERFQWKEEKDGE